jgi:single-strand DNA-binding protein
MSYNVPILNKVMIVGNVVSDPRISLTTVNKIKVANFRIVSCKKLRTKIANTKEEPCYVSVVAWLRIAEMCENNLKRGDKVFIEGSLQSRELSDTKMSVVEILADHIQILTPKKIVVENSQTTFKDNQDNESNTGS